MTDINQVLIDALTEIASHKWQEDHDLSAENSMGNADDVFYDGVEQGQYYCAVIAREALAKIKGVA